MAPESEDPSSPVRDGLSQGANPVPRERTEQTAPADDADGSANLDFDFSGADEAGQPEEAPGLNVAAGPAEEADRESGDEEDLTTDISPSD
ncbi:hypothetical protein [Arthrobacter zhaoguopingii]|uniref:hypothetical protein n=1 Tax=Arthrobacter zhaoguopingii TaxID=2681491 RepID=UPI0013574E81|nr:hypothetical protein [Arthrobacter zhaoguopingii]